LANTPGNVSFFDEKLGGNFTRSLVYTLRHAKIEERFSTLRSRWEEELHNIGHENFIQALWCRVPQPYDDFRFLIAEPSLLEKCTEQSGVEDLLQTIGDLMFNMQKTSSKIPEGYKVKSVGGRYTIVSP
jgi:hypothetical protein